MAFHVVIMAGGGGTRLWPASRKQRPKQFLPLLPKGETLIGATAARLTGVVPPERLYVVTASDQVDEVKRCAPTVPHANIIIEPSARNTAACVGLSAVDIVRKDPEAVIAVVPADQYVRDVDAYRKTMLTALKAAAAGKIITVGIEPTHAETGFGYVERGTVSEHDAFRVERFVEKPDLAKAQQYLSAGNYLWNSGMFFFGARHMLDLINEHLPKLGALLGKIESDAAQTAALYPTAESISIDFGVMEKLQHGEVWVVPGDFGWNDVGSWSALPDLVPADATGNVGFGEHLAIDGKGNILYAEGKRIITALGVSDLIIVATDDAVMVMPKDRAQDVKKIVEKLAPEHR